MSNNSQAQSESTTGASGTEDAKNDAKDPGTRRRWWPWVALVAIVALIATPLSIFGYAYSQYTVPEPEELVNNQVATIVARDETTQLARVVPPEGYRSHVTLEAIPDWTENAVLAAEDREFWSNSGFSVTGFGRAALGQLTGNDSAGGGSTVTQQYVKNTLVGDERSYIRKFRELVYSVKMTSQWSKEEILNAYLNTVYFGRNAYGVQAASHAYFGHDVEELDIAQSAVLAAMIQRPSALDPWTNREEAEARWNYVLDGMVDMGVLPAPERATMVFPEVRDPAQVQAYTEAPGANGHIKDQVIRELARIGISEADLNTGGLTIVTTIDMAVQNSTVDAVDTALAPLQEDARAAAVTIDPHSGAVRGYFGGHDSNGWDYANAPLQTGSTFKVMALAAALQQGISLDTIYDSSPYPIPGTTDKFISNVAGSCGYCSIEEAFKQSLNTSFMRLQADLSNTTQDTADMAHALGVARSLPGVPETLTENGEQPYEGIVLGQYTSRPLDMATAMATLANRGLWHETYFVEKVTANSGEVLYEREAGIGERRVSAQVADNVLQAMGPIAAWSGGALAGGRVSAAKTGTAQLGDTGTNKDTWMVGATPQLATAVWVGTADNTTAIFNAWGGNMYGAGAPTQIWKAILDSSLAGQEIEYFTPATPINYGRGTYGNTPPVVTWDPSWSTDDDSETADDGGAGDGGGAAGGATVDDDPLAELFDPGGRIRDFFGQP